MGAEEERGVGGGAGKAEKFRNGGRQADGEEGEGEGESMSLF